MVVAEVNEDIQIYRNARFSVVMTGIIGSKYLKVEQGTPDAGVLKAGDYIQGADEVPMDVMIAQTMSPQP